MNKLLAGLAAVLVLVSACSAGQPAGDPVKAAARQVMEEDDMADASITSVVQGEPGVRGADELYCVATDATTQNGELPYLLVVWRTGNQWQATQLVEGYYEWDLQGCPR